MNAIAIIDRLQEARDAIGMSRKDMYDIAGMSPVEQNWRHADQSPTLATVGRLASAARCHPRWLAYGPVAATAPQERTTRARAIPVAVDLASKSGLDIAALAWRDGGRRLDDYLWSTLDRLGLADFVYLFWYDRSRFRHAVIGRGLIDVLGLDWWSSAPGKVLGAHDPDTNMAEWVLPRYRETMQKGEPLRDDCAVTSYYSESPVGCIYERLLLPCQFQNRKALMVVIRMEE